MSRSRGRLLWETSLSSTPGSRPRFRALVCEERSPRCSPGPERRRSRLHGSSLARWNSTRRPYLLNLTIADRSLMGRSTVCKDS
ncbi:hypothetical protein AOLI_G00178170 [Acnodon oligacanthus]